MSTKTERGETQSAAIGRGSDEATEDAFLGGRLTIAQPRRGYRAGIDAVLLAATVQLPVATLSPGMENDERVPPRVLDVGAGVGTVGLCVAARLAAVEVTLLEPEPAYARLAQENIARNDLAARVRLVATGIATRAEVLAAAGLAADGFDHVLANPPYHARGRGTGSPEALKAAAHAMAEGDLDAWGRFLARMTRPAGTATMIHRADALAEVLAAFGGRFGGLAVLPIQPRADVPAIRILVRGIKGSRAPLRLLPALVLHGDGHSNAFTPAVRAILAEGAALALA